MLACIGKLVTKLFIIVHSKNYAVKFSMGHSIFSEGHGPAFSYGPADNDLSTNEDAGLLQAYLLKLLLLKIFVHVFFHSPSKSVCSYRSGYQSFNNMSLA